VGVDREAYRAAMARLATGVTVLTTRDDDVHEVMTASAVTSVSLQPALLLASVAVTARWLDAVRRYRVFAVNVLAAHHEELARWCAGQARHSRPDAILQRHVSVAPGSGVLTFDDALVIAECRVHAEHAAGDHVLVLGEVTGVDVRDPLARPLVFVDRTFRTVG
jgi:flavin reductase (DIM6/NTAB) family NADH-FMN oxidoreductase RutF